MFRRLITLTTLIVPAIAAPAAWAQSPPATGQPLRLRDLPSTQAESGDAVGASGLAPNTDPSAPGVLTRIPLPFHPRESVTRPERLPAPPGVPAAPYAGIPAERFVARPAPSQESAAPVSQAAPMAPPAAVPVGYRTPFEAQGGAAPIAAGFIAPRAYAAQAVAHAPLDPATAPPPAALQPVGPPAQPDARPQLPAVPAGGMPGRFGLTELVGLAASYNPILRREEANIEAAKGERVQAGLYPNPAMETNNPEVFAGQNSFVNFGFAQTIVVKGKLRMEKAAADQLVRYETAEYRLERSRMITDVRKQFYTALAAKHRVYLARYLTAIAQRGLHGARELEKAGVGTRTDVLLLDTEFQREQVKLRNAETAWEGERKQLAAVVGVPEIVIEDLDGVLFDTPPQFDQQDVQAFLAQTGSYIERAGASITRSQIQLRRAEVEPYPNIRIGPAFQTGTIPHSAQFWLTVEFDIPVWDLNQGNIRKANATVDEKLADLEVLRNELNRKTAELFMRHVTARDRAERIRVQILPNAQEANNLIQDAYIKGLFDVNRLLESQRNLAEVSSDYFEAAEESWTTAAELAGMLQLEQFP